VFAGTGGTTLTVNTGSSAFIEAQTYEVADALTPTVGTTATLSNTDASSQAYAHLGPLTLSRGTMFAAVFGEDNGTTTMRMQMSSPYWPKNLGAGTCLSAIGYAPGGNFSGWITAGTSGGDFAAFICGIT
jgi:hypothetical protein